MVVTKSSYSAASKPHIERLCAFFNNLSIKKKIKFFIDKQSNGFEKWVQFELLHHFEKKNLEVREVEIEKSFHLGDKASKTKAIVDLRYQLNDQAKTCWHAIELKVRVKTTGAIRGAINDIYRLRNIPEESFVFRSVTAVAIFNSDNLEEGNYLKFIKELNRKKRVSATEIPLGDKYKLLIICWSAPPRLASKASFLEFIEAIKEGAQNHEIKLKG